MLVDDGPYDLGAAHFDGAHQILKGMYAAVVVARDDFINLWSAV